MIRRSSQHPERFPDEVLAAYRDNALRRGGLRAMLHWYRALLRGGGWRQWTHSWEQTIHVPTLLIRGYQDSALSIRTTDGTDKYVDDLTLRVLPGISHWVQQEAPEQVNAILRAWVTGMPVPDYLIYPARSHDRCLKCRSYFRCTPTYPSTFSQRNLDQIGETVNAFWKDSR